MRWPSRHRIIEHIHGNFLGLPFIFLCIVLHQHFLHLVSAFGLSRSNALASKRYLFSVISCIFNRFHYSPIPIFGMNDKCFKYLSLLWSSKIYVMMIKISKSAVRWL